MLLIEYVGHTGLKSLTGGHLGRHLEYFKTLNDASVASIGFIKYNGSKTRINKEKNFKIKFQVILVFARTSGRIWANFRRNWNLVLNFFSLWILVVHILSLKNPSDATLASLSISIYSRWCPRWTPIMS